MGALPFEQLFQIIKMNTIFYSPTACFVKYMENFGGGSALAVAGAMAAAAAAAARFAAAAEASLL